MTEEDIKTFIIQILMDLESEKNDGGINCGDFIHAYESIKELVFDHAKQENKFLHEQINSLKKSVELLQEQARTKQTISIPTGRSIF